MKKLLLLAALFMCAMAFGQSKDSAKYAELVCVQKYQKFDMYFVTSSLSSYNPTLDYSPTLSNVYPLDVLNTYAKMGWRLVGTYSFDVNDHYTLHFIIERN